MAFAPYKSHIDTILSTTHPLHREPPETVNKLAIISEGRARIRSYVAQRLLLGFQETEKRPSMWHLHYFLWDLLIGLNYDEADILVLWYHFVPYEEGQGLNQSAKYHYGRSIDQLKLEEIATIIVVGKAPSRYKRNPEMLPKKVTELLESYKQIWNSGDSIPIS